MIDSTDDAAEWTRGTRRRMLLGAGAALAAGLAGCSGGDPDDDSSDDGDGSNGDGDGSNGDGDGSNGDDGGENGDGENGDGEPTRESMGTVAQNAIEEFAIVGWESSASRDIFTVTVAVENAGDQTTDLANYTWGLRMYDESGSELRSGATPSAITLDGETPAGETGEASVEARPDDASAVDSYELFLSCDGTYASGAYCSD